MNVIFLHLESKARFIRLVFVLSSVHPRSNYIYFIDPDHNKIEERDFLNSICNITSNVSQEYLSCMTVTRIFQFIKAQCPSKGGSRSGFDKPIKYSIKLLMLWHNTNRYCKRFNVYVGKDDWNVGKPWKNSSWPPGWIADYIPPCLHGQILSKPNPLLIWTLKEYWVVWLSDNEKP